LKGLLQVTIHIDYDEMFKGNIDSLKLFTGKNDEKGIIEKHMAQIGEEISSILRDNPIITYQMRGDLLPLDKEETGQSVDNDSNTDAIVEDSIQELSDDIEGDGSVLTDDVVDAEFEEVTNSKSTVDYIDLLIQDIDDTEVNRGIIDNILINQKVKEQFAEKYNIPQGQTVDKFKGFTVIFENMAEPYEIRYKDYQTGEIKSFVREE
jgi:hypothetical protein